MNTEALRRIGDALEDLTDRDGKSRTGSPLLLLTAPRAGYGKTHLLGRVAARAQGQAVALPIIFRPDNEITWSSVSHEAMDALRRLQSGMEGWSRLRELSAGVFAALVSRLVRDGRLPCANMEQALRVLAGDPKELFSDGKAAHIIGDWLRKNYGQLRRPLADTARTLPGATNIDAWVDALFACAQHGTAISQETLITLATGTRQSFLLWLELVASWRPVVLFVDHLDGFYRHEQAGLKIASMVLELSSLPGVHVVLSINQDLWQATFAHHLPSALEDRLTASQFLLRGLAADDADTLLRLRMRETGIESGLADQFVSFLQIKRYFTGRPVGSVSARSFLRHAALQWDAFQSMRARGEDPVAPTSPPEPTHEPISFLPLIQPESQPTSTEIFAQQDAGDIQRYAAGLAEPQPAMVETPFSPVPLAADQGGSVEPFVPAALLFQEAAPPQPPEPFLDSPEPAPAPPPPSSPNGLTAPVAPPRQPHAPGAMEKLREMMDRLRQEHANQAPQPPSAAEEATPAPASYPAAGVAARLATVLGQEASTTQATPAQERYEALRQEVASEAQHQRLDLTKVTDMVRLAGRRFPLVRYDEIAVPGSNGGIIPRWTLPGMEILFGLGNLTDAAFWRALSDIAGSRLNQLQAEAAEKNQAPSRLKIVVPKGEHDALAWTGLLAGQSIPQALRTYLEPLHLDPRSLASLYATRRLITEAESGILPVSPTHLMSIVTREMDFFWKRVTRTPIQP